MRVHRLEIAAFGPFRARQIVDFDQFANDGIFLITGKTGAGKSSILDAICFALYDGVPRYEGTGKRLRSDHAREGEPTEVVLEFSTGGERYRVERSPEFLRPKKSGTGFTPEKASAHLYRQVDGEWLALAAKPKDVGELLGEIVGLTRDQFLQVILLAQNRFARFLQADQTERQGLLRTLFGTGRFEHYETALQVRYRDAKAELDRGTDGLAAVVTRAEGLLATAVTMHGAGAGAGAGVAAVDGPESSELSTPSAAPASVSARIERCEAGAMRLVSWVQAGEATVAQAAADHARLDERLTKLVQARRDQQRRELSELAFAALEAELPAIATDRETLHRARRAETVRAAIKTAARAESALQAATERVETAQAAWARSGEDALGAPALDALIEALIRESGGLAEAATAEHLLDAQRVTSLDLAQELREIAEGIDDAERAQANLPEELHVVEAQLAAATLRVATLEDAARDVEGLTGALEAARETAVLAAAVVAAEQAERDCGHALTAASADVDTLRDRRLRGYAAELATGLIDGEPCVVCGSATHPTPRVGDDEPVTPEQIEHAMAHREVCAANERAAGETRRGAETALAEARLRAGGRDVADIEPLLAAAVVRLADAEVAAASQHALTEQRALVVARRESTAAMVEALRERQLVATAALGQAQATLAATTATVDTARGEFATVQERVASTEQRIERARSLADAQTTAAACATAAHESRELRETQLSAEGFIDAAAASDALRSAEETAQLEAHVQQHGEQLAHHKRVLLEPELLGLPDDPVDLEGAEAEASTARSVHETAMRDQVRLEAVSVQLADALGEAGNGLESIALLEAEHEVIERLAGAVAGRAPNTHRMRLEAFVLAAELEEIVDAANRRLALMSGDRYRLEHTDALESHGKKSGLGLAVMDQHTGQSRPTHSLSGGETFLASLALALGLAEVVSARAGGITLDTLFIDEGFGSLDGDTLNVAMATLDELRQGGRVVGLISHVEAMKEQIHSQLVIDVAPQGWSEVRAPAQ